MAKEQPKWKPIKKGEKLPCWAFLMTMDGMITNVTAMGVTIAQDAYYLPSISLLDTIKDFPKEESEEKSAEKNSIDKIEPKFEVGDVMRSLGEAKEGITDGLPVVVSIDEEYYHCNNELISIKDQDKYEYPPINRKQKYANSIWHDMTEKPQGGENDRTLVVFEDGYSTTSNALLHIGFGYSKPYKWAYVNDILRLTLSENEQKPADWLQEVEDKLANATPQQLAEWKEKYFKEESAEWSEVDEEIARKGVLILKSCATGFPTDEKFANEFESWLKSIKDRVQPQANIRKLIEKLEWLEDTKTTVWSMNEENIINNICDFIQGHTNFADSAKEAAVVFLKSLKDRVLPQPKQEWSEEEIENCAREAEDNSCIILAKHIRQLKSLRPQNRWKPNEEQMCALEYFIIHNNEHSRYAKDLEWLRKDLKKLKG